MGILLYFYAQNAPAPPALPPEYMDRPTAHSLVAAYWRDNWSLTPTLGENAKGAEGDAAHARISFLPVLQQQSTMGAPGNRKCRRQDLFVVQLRVLQGIGVEQMTNLIEAVTDLLESVRIGGLTFLSPQPQNVGNDGKWFVYQLTTLFDYYEIK